MPIPPSPHFTPVDLDDFFNTDRARLPSSLRTPPDVAGVFGASSCLGIPFRLGPAHAPNVLVLDTDPVAIPLGGVSASYVLFLHAVVDRVSNYQTGLADYSIDGNANSGFMWVVEQDSHA